MTITRRLMECKCVTHLQNHALLEIGCVRDILIIDSKERVLQKSFATLAVIV